MVDQQNGDAVESTTLGSGTHDEFELNGGQCFSPGACDYLGRAIEKYHRTPGAFDDVETATYTLCQEAKAYGLGVNEALARIRRELDRAIAGRQLTSSDRAAVIALAVDQCVRAYYAGKSAREDAAKEADRPSPLAE